MTKREPTSNESVARPRVLYASFDEVPAPKGAAVHIQHFAAAIAEVADLTLVTPRFGNHDQEFATRAHSEVRPYRHVQLGVPEENFLDRAQRFREKLAALLRAESFDLIQFRSIWEGAVAAALGGQARLIYEVNALPSIELKYLYPGVAADRTLFYKLRNQELSLLAAADRILTPSPVTAQFVARQGIRVEKIRIVPNGVDPELFSPPENEPATPPLQLLYAGTLAPWQGLEMLYRAMRAVAASCDCRLWVVGQSRKQWVRRHRRLVGKLRLEERVEFRDAVSQAELAALVRQAHVCVAPLRASDRNVVQGCCPLKLLEYAAAGRAILAADLPAVRCVLEPGAHALLYNPRKVSHIRNAILELAESPELRRRLGEAARERVLEKFTWQSAREQLLACYAEVLGPMEITATPEHPTGLESKGPMKVK